MKNMRTLLPLLLLLMFSCNTPQKENSKTKKAALPEATKNITRKHIRLNQLGYFPNSQKTFIVVNCEADSFNIINQQQQIVLRKPLTPKGYWDKSGENIKTGTFSELNTAGVYYITTSDNSISYPFKISMNIYDSVQKAALKSYYYQRASIEIKEPYSGKWKRPLAHPDDSCIFHPSSGRDGGYKPSPKGWYDAGDFSKYTVNAGITVGTMIAAYEYYPSQFPDKYTNIPESGNNISDLLDEQKWELDWLLTMQDEDGGGYVKLSDANWPAMVLPHKAACDRFFVGKSTAASLNLAATFAKAYRVFASLDSIYANQMLEAALKAWEWAEENNNVLYFGTEGINSGNYPDKDLHEEFIWAAAELYASTQNQEFKDYVMKHKREVIIQVSESWRTFNDNLGYITLINTPNILTKKEKQDLQMSLVACAERLVTAIDSLPYRIPLDKFVWGSNSDILNHAIILSEAFRITKNRKFLDAVIETVDYIFGKNATGYSFVSGYGSKTPKFLHHRPSFDDEIIQPVPGFLSGGPNVNREDDKNKYGKVDYYDTLAANTYIDHWESWASNEVAINWNAPLVYVLAFLNDNKEFLENDSYLP